MRMRRKQNIKGGYYCIIGGIELDGSGMSKQLTASAGLLAAMANSCTEPLTVPSSSESIATQISHIFIQ